MRDGTVVLLAVVVAVGAVVARPVPLLAASLVVAVALAWRRPLVLVVGAGLLASGLSAMAWAGLSPPPPTRVDGTVTLLTDPVQRGEAVRVDVRIGRRRVEAWASGPPAWRLDDALAGERVHLTGRLRPVPEGARVRLAVRHVGARLSVDEVGDRLPGDPLSRLANGIRRTLTAGAAPLTDDHRALFTGLVLGDDRHQSDAMAADFRAAGLTHLLAVSGQNVAFVLAVAGPVLRRLRLGPRWAATVAVIAFFALVTRFEPSVLRASAMAAVAVTAATAGRPASRLRILSLAVAGLLLIDPLLVRSVGFLLSTGASLGIVLFARPLAARLPGPRPLADALAVTVAAQAGVAPILVPAFGGLPVASLPANLLAVPAAGPVMTWGLTAGILAGLGGEPLAGLLHLPTGVLVAWIAGVARWAARAPLGDLRLPHVVSLAVIAAAAVCLRGRPRLRTLLGAAVVAVLLAPGLASLSPAPAAGEPVARGSRLWRAGGGVVVVLDGPVDTGRVLDGLRRAGVRRVDVVVSTSGGRGPAGAVLALRSRLPVRAVLAPAGHRIRGATTPPTGARIRVGGLVLDVVATEPGLDIEVARGPPGGAAGRR